MSVNDIYLSREGYEKLREELECLKTIRRRELSRAIGQARLHGDIKENAEYDIAKEEQAMNEAKIAKLEDKLSRAQILDTENLPTDKVCIGLTVRLKDIDLGEDLEYTFVSEEESDYDRGQISIASPVGKALLGHKENEIVEIKVPAGILRYKILSIKK